MKKPQVEYGKLYYDLFEVLDYVDKEVPRFRNKIWEELCDTYYINNDTMMKICFEDLIEENTPEEIVEGIEYMFKEFPDIKNGEVDFKISW